MNKIFATIYLIAALTPCAFAAPAHMQPGEWQITTRMVMPGMPVAMPPMSHRYCYTKQQIEQNKVVKHQGNCKEQHTRINGNTMSWKTICAGEGGAMTMTGEITLMGTSYTGKTTTEMPNGRKMTSYISGKRLGPCK